MKLKDIFVKEVSLVDFAANGEKFLLVKRLEKPAEPKENLEAKKICDDLKECLELAKKIN